MTKTVFKIDFDGQLYNFNDDKPMADPVVEIVNGEQKITGEKPVTYRMIAVRACMNGLRGEDDLPGDEKAKNFQLGMKISKGGIVELDDDERIRLKTRVRKGFAAHVSGQMDMLLESAVASDDKEAKKKAS